MEEVKVLNVKALLPVLVEFDGDSMLGYIDVRNRTVYNALGTRLDENLERQIIEFKKAPQLPNSPAVGEALERSNHIDYTRGKNVYRAV